MDAATDSKVEVNGTMKVTDEHWNSIFRPKKTIGCSACGSNMTKVEQDEFLEDQWNCGCCGNTELVVKEAMDSE